MKKKVYETTLYYWLCKKLTIPICDLDSYNCYYGVLDPVVISLGIRICTMLGKKQGQTVNRSEVIEK